MSNIEIELKGPLNKNDFKRLLKYCQENGKLMAEIRQVVVFLNAQKIKNFKNIESPHRLSLSIDDKKTQLKIKESKYENAGRKEFNINLEKAQIQKILNFLELLSFTGGYIRPSHRYDFKVKGFEITLKTESFIGDHYELEIPKRNLATKDAIEKGRKFIKSLNLEMWNDKKFNWLMRNTDKLHPDAGFKTTKQIWNYLNKNYKELIK